MSERQPPVATLRTARRRSAEVGQALLLAVAFLCGTVRGQAPASPAAPSSVPADAQTTQPPATVPTPAQDVPTPMQQSVPGLANVPKGVPSMMPEAPGETVDRMVAIVNGEIILDSDVNEENRFEAIQPYPGAANATVTREREIERLVNRDLILSQAKLLPEQDQVSDEKVDDEVSQLKKTLPGCRVDRCETDAGWASYLAKHGFTVAQFRMRWMQRIQVLDFIQERFGAGTSVSAAQVREFYNKTMLPQYAAAHAKPASLASVEPQIREILQRQQVASLLRDWLQSLRAQGSITILHPGEEAP